jgi:hypothetical protein
MIRRWILATSTMLATLAGCGVTELYIGFLPTTTSTTTTTGSTTTSTVLCSPGEARSCYDGPAGTEGVGLCRAGTQTCAEDGASWGECMGEVLPKPEDCATSEDEDCDGKAPPCKGVLLWAKSFGDGGDQRATSIAADPSGNVLVTGYFSGTVDFGGGPLVCAGSNDVFIAKLNGSTGTHIWSKRFGDVSGQSAQGIAVDASGNALVVGNFSGTVDFGGGPLAAAGAANAFVAKLDVNGQHMWSRQIGAAGGGVGVAGVAVDGDGNVLVTGYFSGTIDFGGGPVTSAGPQDVFITKLDAMGAHVWTEHFGAPDDPSPLGDHVAADTFGNVLVTGYFSGTIDFGGGPFMTANVSDAFAVKLDATGTHQWSKHFGSPGATSDGRSIAIGPDGDVLITGGFSGSIDFGGGPISASGLGDVYLVELGAGGAQAWSKHFGAASSVTTAGGVGVAVDASGNVVVTGAFTGSVNFGDAPLASMSANDIFLAKLDASGAHQWSKRFGEAGTQSAMAVAVDAVGDVMLAGYFTKAVDFGNGALVSAGGTDAFVAVFGP